MFQQSIEQQILYCQFSDPLSHNAIGPSFLQKWQDIVDTLSKQSPIKALVFCPIPSRSKNCTSIALSGGHLKELAGLQGDQLENFFQGMRHVNLKLRRLPIPTAIFLDGLVMGGGAELATFFDLRIVTESTSFFLKQLQIGLPTGFAGEIGLNATLGYAQSLFHLLQGSTLASGDLLAKNLVQDVMPDNTNFHEVKRYFAQLFNHNPILLKIQKKLLIEAPTVCSDSETQQTKAFLKCWRQGKHKEFIEKYDS